jgi:hypothetical protein
MIPTNQNCMHEQITTHGLQAIPATAPSRTFSLPFCYLQINTLKLNNCSFTCWFIWVSNLVSHIWLFDNRALRKIFGPQKEEVTGDWRRLHSEQLHDPYCSENILVIKSWRMRGTERVAREKSQWRLILVCWSVEEKMHRYQSKQISNGFQCRPAISHFIRRSSSVGDETRGRTCTELFIINCIKVKFFLSSPWTRIGE